jgi:hypothetical protein
VAKGDDRQLTAKEYEQFVKDCEELAAQQDLAELTVLCDIQEKRIRELQLYVRILEDLNAARNDKLLKLQHNLEQLEKELIELRCLVPKEK